MTTLAVELSDVGIRVKRTDEPASRGPSPGYALLDGKRMIIGDEAYKVARLHPTRINHRFWCELSDAPLRGTHAGGLSHADMAHAQLEQIWRECGSGVSAVLLAIPGYFSPESLGLLLGIARACGMPVTGLIDLAVAGSAESIGDKSALHVDLHLHRVVVTAIRGGAVVERQRVEIGEGTGLVPLRRAWAKRIAEAFVRETRFDPLHSATTEQQLFDRLPDWFSRLESDRVAVFEMESGGRTLSAKFDRDEIVQATARDYDEIVEVARRALPDNGETRVLFTGRAAALPGLLERFETIVPGRSDGRLLPADAVVDGTLKHSAIIHSPGEAVPLVTCLGPAQGVSETLPGESMPPDVPVARPTVTAAPSHLQVDGIAHPITEVPIRIGTSPPSNDRHLRLVGATAGISRLHCSIVRDGGHVFVEDHSRHGSFLGELRVEHRAKLAVGDRLRLGSPGIELQMIQVLEDDGASQD